MLNAYFNKDHKVHRSEAQQTNINLQCCLESKNIDILCKLLKYVMLKMYLVTGIQTLCSI